MDYIVAITYQEAPGKAVEKRYYEFSGLEYAKRKADYLAERYREAGYDFNILIYEVTNY